MSDLMLDVDQAGELKAAFRRTRGSNGAEWTNEAIKRISEGHFLGSVLDALEGRAKIVPTEQKVRVKAEVIDTIIRVDRSIRPIYPDWVQMVMHPEFENTGPAEFDLAEVEQWLHNKQKQGVVEGNVIYQFLKDNDMLKTCLGLRDGEEIQKKGIDLFRRFFKGKAVYLWKSVVQGRGGRLYVPCLRGGGSEVLVDWRWLDDVWYSLAPALRLAS